MSAPDLYFDIHADYSTRQIALCGELDVATASCLTTAVTAFQKAALGDITVRLNAVTFIDTAGLRAVHNASSAQLDKGASLSVTGANALVRRVFTLGNLDGLLQPQHA